jgi:hypothetical protein
MYIAYVAWWLHPSFRDKTHRLAAELVAFRALEPALRSRGGIEQSAIDLSASLKIRNSPVTSRHCFEVIRPAGISPRHCLISPIVWRI